MTQLIQAQLLTITIMFCCGVCGGLIRELYTAAAASVRLKGGLRGIYEASYFLCLGFLFSEFNLFCENGRLSFTGIISFLAGLLLWKRFFCGILNLGDCDEKKENKEE